MAESIKQLGFIQPLSIKPKSEIKKVMINGTVLCSEKYELIAGERRRRAAKLLGLDKVPCIIVKTDEIKSAYMTLTENIQRRELDFFEEADAMKRIQLEFGATKSELSKRLCMSQSAVANRLKLLQLSLAERELIRDAGMSERHAREFLRLEDEEIRIRFIKRAARHSFSVQTCSKEITSILNDILKPKDEARPEAKHIYKLSDIKFFMNTLNKSLETLLKAGVDVKQEQHEENGFYEIKLKIAKKDTAIIK